MTRPFAAAISACGVLILGGGSGGNGGNGGSGGMPVAAFNLTGGSGDLYVFAQANGATQSSSPVVNDQNAYANKAIAQVGIPGNNAGAQNHFSASSGSLFGYYQGATAFAAAIPGTFAFARSDINVTYELVRTTSAPLMRVKADWTIYADGISDLFIQMRRWTSATTVATVFGAEVSAYITPETVTASANVILPSGAYELWVYGSVQANSSFLNPDSGSYDTSLSAVSGNLADVNGDGIVNGADLGALLAAWGTVARFHGADLNQDQSVGGADLGVLLSAW